MKKIISIILVLVLCLGCCFVLSACEGGSKSSDNEGESKTELFDNEAKLRLAELSLKNIVSDYNVCLAYGLSMEITRKTTIKEVVDFIVSNNKTVQYAFVDGEATFLSVCENINSGYKVKDEVKPARYYSNECNDMDTAKRMIAEDRFREVLKLVDYLELWIQIDEDMTIQQVVELIEYEGETVSTKHLNTSITFRSVAKPSGFVGFSSVIIKDVDWINLFAE